MHISYTYKKIKRKYNHHTDITEFPDAVSPSDPFKHRFQQVFYTVSGVRTELM